MSAAVSVVPSIAMREIDVNLTNLCNLACIHCSYSSTPHRGEPALPGAVVHRVLDEAAQLGTRVVHWSGGEPVLHRDIDALIAHGVERGFGMRLLSNGALLTAERLEGLWSAGLRKLLISVDGLSGNHDFHRAQRGLFDKTIKAVERAAAYGFHVRVNSVGTARNIDELPDVMDLVVSLGARTYTVFYCIPVGRGRALRDLMVPPRRWRRFIDDMRLRARPHIERGVEVAVEKAFAWLDEPSPDSGPADGRGGSCLGFLDKCDYVNILADGRVFPCVCFIDHAPPLGNVLERPLADILHDPAPWRFYRDVDALPVPCTRCTLASACRGGNRPNAFVATGAWRGMDPRCDGDPHAAGFAPLCFMVRENLATSQRAGFAEAID